MSIPRGVVLPAVTGIRFPAAALVLIGHAAMFNAWVAPLNDYFWADAVPFFFLLSGFILAHVYPSLDNWAARKQFLVARIARIYPLHLATFLLVVLLLPPDVRTSLEKPIRVLKNLTLTQSWSSKADVFFSFNPPAWSLSVEFFLYACFPLLIYKWRRVWWLWLPATYLVVMNVHHLMPRAATSGTLPLRYIFLFTVGMAAASVYRWLQPRVHYGRLVGTMLELGAGVLLFYRHSLFSGHFAAMGAPLAYASVVLVMALGRGWIAQLFATRPLVVLGESSFALYMFHHVVLRWMNVVGMQEALSAGAYLLFYVTVSMVGALALWRYVECPARNWIMARYKARQAKSAAQAAEPLAPPAATVDPRVPQPHFLRKADEQTTTAGRSESVAD